MQSRLQFDYSKMYRCCASDSRLTGLIGAFLLLALTGCRTYGVHEDSNTLNLKAASNAVDRLESSLEKAKMDLTLLGGAASSNSSLIDDVTKWSTVIERHAVTARQYRGRLDVLAANSPSYRSASRLLGAVVAEQTTLNAKYHYLLDAIEADLGRERQMMDGGESRYYAVPPYFERVAAGIDVRTMSSVLAQTS